MGGGIPHDAVGASVGILTYSVLCLSLNTLLVCLLWSYGERWAYVTLLSMFAALGTVGSITQQVHYAVAWKVIKEAQYDAAIESLSKPSAGLGGAHQSVDVVLFWIQFYCYNVISLNVLFWTVALFCGSWGVRRNWLGDWAVRIGPISKVFAIVHPGIIIAVLNIEAVKENTVILLIFANITMFVSMSAGSIFLVLILYKYMRTRRLVAGHNKRGGWWASRGSKGRHVSDVAIDGTTESGGTAATYSSIYDRALVTRFTIGFVILAGFQVAIIIFTRYQTTHNAALAKSGGPDFTVANAIADILLFIPGVSASLVAFLVFGTSKSWRQYLEVVVGVCGSRRKVQEQRQARGHNWRDGRSGERLSTPRLSSLAELNGGKDGDVRVRIFLDDGKQSDTPDAPDYISMTRLTPATGLGLGNKTQISATNMDFDQEIASPYVPNWAQVHTVGLSYPPPGTQPAAAAIPSRRTEEQQRRDRQCSVTSLDSEQSKLVSDSF